MNPFFTNFNKMSVLETARAARQASVSLQSITNEQKNEALLRIKQVLSERREEIFKANEEDKKVFSTVFNCTLYTYSLLDC